MLDLGLLSYQLNLDYEDSLRGGVFGVLGRCCCFDEGAAEPLEEELVLVGESHVLTTPCLVRQANLV